MNSQKGYTMAELMVCIIFLCVVVGVIIGLIAAGLPSLTTVLKVLGVIALVIYILRAL